MTTELYYRDRGIEPKLINQVQYPFVSRWLFSDETYYQPLVFNQRVNWELQRKLVGSNTFTTINSGGGSTTGSFILTGNPAVDNASYRIKIQSLDNGRDSYTDEITISIVEVLEKPEDKVIDSNDSYTQSFVTNKTMEKITLEYRNSSFVEGVFAIYGSKSNDTSYISPTLSGSWVATGTEFRVKVKYLGVEKVLLPSALIVENPVGGGLAFVVQPNDSTVTTPETINISAIYAGGTKPYSVDSWDGDVRNLPTSAASNVYKKQI